MLSISSNIINLIATYTPQTTLNVDIIPNSNAINIIGSYTSAANLNLSIDPSGQSINLVGTCTPGGDLVNLIGTCTPAIDLSASTAIPQRWGGHGEYYPGPYSVQSSFTLQTLMTEEKVMRDDVTINPMPYSEVSNPQGGLTINIGG